MYRVIKDVDFDKQARKVLTKVELQELDMFIEELKQGNISGKPLGYKFFREKKIGSKRIYFLVYEDIAIILFVDVSTKKYQQETIDEIKSLIPEFKEKVYVLDNKK